jgi:hypothetical protein
MFGQFHKGSRVMRRANPRHTGSLTTVLHRNDGAFATVRWDNGWLELLIPLDELDHADPEAGPTECDRMQESLGG